MKEIKEFINLIEDEKFYEAHEALEETWFPIRKKKNDCAMVLKGFINGAVSLELYKRGKIEQSRNVHKNYLKYVILERINNTNSKDQFLILKEFMDKRLESIYS